MFSAGIQMKSLAAAFAGKTGGGRVIVGVELCPLHRRTEESSLTFHHGAAPGGGIRFPRGSGLETRRNEEWNFGCFKVSVCTRGLCAERMNAAGKAKVMVLRKNRIRSAVRRMWLGSMQADGAGAVAVRRASGISGGGRQVFRSFPALLVLGLCTAALLMGCARRKVAIPSDWQIPPPQTAVVPPQDVASRPAEEPGSIGPILRSTPSFREENLPAARERAPVEAAGKREPRAPQQLASMHLVEQAGTALSQGKPDAAIPLLEQAVQIDAYNGEAFLGLARAWKMKGARNKAQEFAQKAEVLLQDHPSKLKQVYLFQADLFQELGDAKRTELYRNKASKL